MILTFLPVNWKFLETKSSDCKIEYNTLKSTYLRNIIET